MSNPSNPAPSRTGGLSLYANLLDSSSSASAASISRAPVVFRQGATDGAQGDDASVKKQRINPAALRFQPTKRPQLSSQKPKPKSTFPKTTLSTLDAPARNTPASVPLNPPAKSSTLADWTAAGDDEDVNGFYGGGEKRQRGGRKKRKKNREEFVVAQDWDDIYDPSRPNSYDEYKHSDEKIREVREWKDRLYAHRMARKHSSEGDSEDNDPKRLQMSNQFAPPPNYSFAPPPIELSSQVATNVADLPDKTGDDAYARRLKLSQGQPEIPPPPHQALEYPSTDNIPPPPPLNPQEAGVITRMPVRYELPPPPSDIPSTEAELEQALAEEVDDEGPEALDPETAPRSIRPGQKGFAERLMSKYGWSKGTGLGADGSGIINPLHVKVEKRRKKPDSEGGGFADPKAIGKIIGGQKNEAGKQADRGKFGPMSEVIILRGMVDGMNLDDEYENTGDGGLMQEIGDECNEKYGNVERVYIDRSSNGPAKIFVKFTSQLSALKAVNALEGRIFNGNTIAAMFYDADRFERGIYI